VDCEGCEKSVDEQPAQPKLVLNALVPLSKTTQVYVARRRFTFPLHEGMAIVDAGEAGRPKLDQMFTANGLAQRCQ